MLLVQFFVADNLIYEDGTKGTKLLIFLNKAFLWSLSLPWYYFFCILTNQPSLLEAEILLFGNYDMVKNPKTEDFTCFGKLFVRFCVGFAWFWVT